MPISHRHTFLKYPEYISPLPTDDLIKVGMVKQEMYNQGVEKVQQSVDQLDQAGFSLVKDVDKKYFSEEMDKFMKAVNESSAKTDFSNMANVRNILNIGKPLENNPYILNAIQSSHELMRRQDILSKLNPKERSAANDWDFMNDADEWFNDGQVGSKLSQGKAYTPFVDASAFVMSQVKNLEPTIKAQVIKDGYITEEEVKAVTQERLRDWMEKSLPEHVKNQIAIDANYQLKGVSDDQLFNYYRDTRAGVLAQVNNNIQQYHNVYDKLNEQERKQLSYLELQKEALMNPTPEEAKAAYIQDKQRDFITGQARLYAYEQEKKSVHANPFALAAENNRLAKDLALYKQGIQYGFNEDGTPRTLYDMEQLKGENRLEMQKLKNSQKIGKLPAAERKLSDKASNLMDAVTKGFTVGEKWENLDLSRLSNDNRTYLESVLKRAMIGMGPDSNDDFTLDNVQIMQDANGKVTFRVDTGYGDVFNVGQDRFEPAIRTEFGLKSDTPFEGNLITEKYPSAEYKIPSTYNGSGMQKIIEGDTIPTNEDLFQVSLNHK